MSGPERLYISDGPSRCIAVWEVATGKGKRLLLPRAVSHPSDVLYLALVPPSNLYFTYYKSPDMYVVDTRDERGMVKKVGSKPPGVILIGREGRNILFRVSGSQRLYSWNTQRDLSRHTFKQRDAGGLGDPLHAVGDIGRTWVLEADLSAFLSGKKVSHRIRAINHTYTTCGQPQTSQNLFTTESPYCPPPTAILPKLEFTTSKPEPSSTSPTIDLTEEHESLTTPEPPCCPPPTAEEPEQATITPLPPCDPQPLNYTTTQQLQTTVPPEVVLQAPPTMAEEFTATTTPIPNVEIEADKKLVPSPPI